MTQYDITIFHNRENDTRIPHLLMWSAEVLLPETLYTYCVFMCFKYKTATLTVKSSLCKVSQRRY